MSRCHGGTTSRDQSRRCCTMSTTWLSVEWDCTGSASHWSCAGTVEGKDPIHWSNHHNSQYWGRERTVGYDTLVTSYLQDTGRRGEVFTRFYIQTLGYYVPRARLRDSIWWVDPYGRFNRRSAQQIPRVVYDVEGPMHLVHIDGTLMHLPSFFTLSALTHIHIWYTLPNSTCIGLVSRRHDVPWLTSSYVRSLTLDDDACHDVLCCVQMLSGFFLGSVVLCRTVLISITLRINLPLPWYNINHDSLYLSMIRLHNHTFSFTYPDINTHLFFPLYVYCYDLSCMIE